MLVAVQNLGVRRIITTSESIMGKENVIRTTKLICRCRKNIVDKNNLRDTEASLSTHITSSTTTTASN